MTIPSLAQVFTTFRDSLLYNVELKTDTVYYPEIEARLAALVAAHGLAEHILVSSFNHEGLRLVRCCEPNLSLGLLLNARQAQQSGSPDGIVARAHEFSCFSVHPEFTIL